MQKKLLHDRGLTKEGIQPGEMAVWSDPFAKKDKDKPPGQKTA